MKWCLPVWLLLCIAAIAAQPAVPATEFSDSRLVLDSGQFATGLAMPTVSTLRLQGQTRHAHPSAESSMGLIERMIRSPALSSKLCRAS